MKASVITRRWLIKTFSFIAALMAVVVVSLSLGLHSFYYNAARTTLSSGFSNLVPGYFTSGGTTDEAFNQAARSYVETFSARDTVGVWVIDRHGAVVATSDGFRAPDDVSMPDYMEASSGGTNRAFWHGKISGDEKIMALTCLLGQTDGEHTAAVRYMVSLKNVDAQWLRIVLLLIAAAVAALALTVIPGALYIEKLMRAVRNTTDAANRIAKGDYDAKIEYAERDEIGDLCAAVHDMAGEISAAERLKNDFVSTVSHELRTPLTAIRGWVETLRQVGADDPVLTRRGMDVIQKETTRLGGMVEELLDFSRIESGRMRLERVRMDVLAELDGAVLTFRERAVREGKTLLFSADETPVQIFGDPDRITQVFVNILDNALKYTDAGGIVRVETGQVDGMFCVLVTDTGKGIAAEALPHVKEKFYKADSTVHGSGIGLAVADEIVRLHGGSLTVESVAGKGTAVLIQLPLGETEGGIHDGQKE